jgi:hypothetical protein
MPLHCEIETKHWPEDIPRLIRTLADLWQYWSHGDGKEIASALEIDAHAFRAFAEALAAEAREMRSRHPC